MSKTLEQKDSIIEKNLEISWFLKASIESFLVSGKPSGTFRSNLHKIMEEYATECIKASFEKASELATTEKVPFGVDYFYRVDKSSITSKENYVLL